jgi:hypothetical protein
MLNGLLGAVFAAGGSIINENSASAAEPDGFTVACYQQCHPVRQI